MIFNYQDCVTNSNNYLNLVSMSLIKNLFKKNRSQNGTTSECDKKKYIKLYMLTS